jgi:glyceraldehyde 3-phosphate dehydrogenase
MSKKIYETSLQNWIEGEKLALDLIAVVGKLWFEKSIELVMFRKQMVDRSASQLLQLHQYARDVVKQPLSIKDTLWLAKAILRCQIAPSRLDIGRIGAEWLQEKENYIDETDYIYRKMKAFIGKDKIQLTPKDVVLYGFGRIGRLAARELIAQAGKGEQLRLRAIVTRDKNPEDIIKRADLLRADSVHGTLPTTKIFWIITMKNTAEDVQQPSIWS